MNPAVKKTLILVAKFGVSAGIIGYLIYNAQHDETFHRIRDEPKDWMMLGLSLVFVFAGVLLTFVRWFVLSRALDLSFRLTDAIRLGFLGYLFNLVSLGSVGGDLFKAIAAAREQPGRRAEAVATVVVDRIIGLYAIFVVASLAILFTDVSKVEIPEVKVICQATNFCTVAGAVGFVALLVPGLTSGRVSSWLTRLPWVGHTAGRLLGAVRMYKSRLPIVLLAGLMSIVVHTLSTTGIYLGAKGLPGSVPSLSGHFVIVPLAMVASALPLPLNGLGAFEGVFEFLYTRLPSDLVVLKGQGLAVALVYRLVSVVLTGVAAVVYMASRRQVAEVLHDSQAKAAVAELEAAGTEV